LSGNILLETRALTKRYGGLTATDSVELSVRQGELHALIGPNGAGKTTLVHQLSGALRPDKGQVLFEGRDITHLPMHERVHQGLARSYQITSIFKRFSVLDNIVLAIQARSAHHWWRLRPARNDRACYGETQAVAQQVGLEQRIDSAAGSLSHGEQRELELAIVLATNAKLLLMDEPLAGMGLDESARMVALLRSLKTQRTILLVEHDMDAVFQLADTISTLVSGRIVASGTPEYIRAHPQVRRAYLGDELEQA
jgi:branched-chain amino acid transport system ATP-binding protein